jgi:hypothetical protein
MLPPLVVGIGTMNIYHGLVPFNWGLMLDPIKLNMGI